MNIRSANRIAAIATLVACVAHATEYHVSIYGDDNGTGTKASPFRTIQHAADLAGPGDVVTVHEGVYRERVNPRNGGTSEAERITYRSAKGETVVIKGSEIVSGWSREQHDTWTVSLPNSFFGEFNPFDDLICGDWFKDKGREHHTGAVYLNGHWLSEAANREQVLEPAGEHALWFAEVDEQNTLIMAQFPGFDPNRELVEVNMRRAVFYPDKPGRNYITVSGFILEQAATPWAPPTAEQIGLLGTHWSKGWIIEDNVIRYSVCAGLTLGKYGDEYDNTSANSSAGYVKTIERATERGWNRKVVGGHIVRNNHISHCEQAGIVGSLGAIFSTLSGNEIHDIHMRRYFSGSEMAGIKIHAPIDMRISNNHLYRCNRGIWLDWMAQGTRVTGNLLHNIASDEIDWPLNWSARTRGGENDLFLEVNHGPILVDNNIFLSAYSFNNRSRGVTFAHNLFAGAFRIVPYDARETPYHAPHSTEVLGFHDNPLGDNQFYNNIFARHADLRGYDNATLRVTMSGNLYLNGTKPPRQEEQPLVEPDYDPELRLEQRRDGWYLHMKFRESWLAPKRKLVTSELLGKALIPDQPYEDADGMPYRIDTDYFGRERNFENPATGPFAKPDAGSLTIKVWPLER